MRTFLVICHLEAPFLLPRTIPVALNLEMVRTRGHCLRARPDGLSGDSGKCEEKGPYWKILREHFASTTTFCG